MKRLIVPVLAAALLTGCSIFGGGEKPVAKPAALKPLKTVRVQARVLWRHGVGDGTHGLQYHGLRVAGAHGDVFTMDPSGLVSAFSASGKALWRHDTGLKLSGGPGVIGDSVVVGSLSGRVEALSRVDGHVLWQRAVSSEVIAPPVGADGVTVVRSGDGRFFAFDSNSGKRLWNYDSAVPRLSVRGESMPMVSDGLLISGTDDGKLVALTLQNGKLAWDQTVQLPTGRTEIERLVDVDANLAISGGNVFAASYGGQLAGLSVNGGRLLWKRNLGSDAGLAAQNGTVFVTNLHGDVLALDANTGNTLWKQDALHDRGVTQPVVDGPWVVVADRFGYMHWLSMDNGHIVGRLEADDRGIQTPPLVMGDRLFVLSMAGRLSAISAKPAGKPGD